MSTPLVSILVPIYNVEEYIERCARSVFEQTYDNLEYIFVDDATPDGNLREIINGQNIRRLYYFLTMNVSMKNSQGYKAIRDKLLSIDTNEWHHIGWNKTIKRYIETHYILILTLKPFYNQYFQCETIAYNIIKRI